MKILKWMIRFVVVMAVGIVGGIMLLVTAFFAWLFE
jgi:hypothetical protein